MRKYLIAATIIAIGLALFAKPTRSNSGGDGASRSGGQPLPYDSKVEYLQSTGSEAVIIPASVANTITKYSSVKY